jgi:hypothetical protein
MHSLGNVLFSLCSQHILLIFCKAVYMSLTWVNMKQKIDKNPTL